jgi:hypothetical protein
MPNLLEDAQKDPKGASYGAFLNPLILTKPNVMNSRPWRGAEIGGGNAHSTARSLAKMYGALARGGELDGHRMMLGRAVIRSRPGNTDDDALFARLHAAATGNGLRAEYESVRTSGRGRLIGLRRSSPEGRLRLLMNQMANGLLVDARAKALFDALYAAL